MKNQYFGDINDYLKYGLLRTICRGSGLRLAVCWMLTPDDGRTDGGRTAYLDAPAKWRLYAPDLFDVLKDAVAGGRRNIAVAETSRMLPGAVYHSETLHDDWNARSRYFNELADRVTASDLVFFDPDNGMEVKSKPKGRKGSSKYLYWDEASRISGMGKSLIVFQHFTREKRDVFIDRVRERFRVECGVGWVGVLRTAHAVYFVVPVTAYEQALRAACDDVGRQWCPHVRLA